MALPSLLLANKIQKKVRKIGFAYPDIQNVFDKLEEEVNELKEAIKSKNNNEIEDELGDLLFVSSLLGAHTGHNPEETLRKACLKFVNRFNAVENELKNSNKSLESASIEEMSQAWITIKAHN